MIFRATLYSTLAYIVTSIIFWAFPILINGMYGLVISLLVSPFIAGYVIYLQDGDVSQKSERWLYSCVFSLLQTLFIAVFVVYYLNTAEGMAIVAENNVQSGLITNLVYAFCILVIFLMYMFANRIGFGLGLKYGAFSDKMKERAHAKMHS